MNAWDALQNPSRDVSVIGPSGALFKERFELWPADQDMVLFGERPVIRIYDISRFNAESGCPYALVTRSDFKIQSNAGQVDCVNHGDRVEPLSISARSSRLALKVKLDRAHRLAAGCASKKQPGSFFRIRETSATTLQLSVHVPAGWSVEIPVRRSSL